MPVRTEMLNQGLVTARDPALLSEGQLQRASNCLYHPNDDSIWTAPGRNRFNATALGSPDIVRGVRHLGFDDAPDVLASYRVNNAAAGKVSIAPFISEGPLTAPFTDFTPIVGAGNTMDSIHYNNKHTLLFGAATPSGDLIGPQIVVKSTSVGRRHGLAPVVSPPKPGPAVAGVSGSGLVPGGWPNSLTYPLGWYSFITTEVHNPEGTDELESAWEGSRAFMVNVNDASKSVQIECPALVNTGKETDGTDLIQSWRVYMAGPVGGTTPVPTGQPQDPPLSAYVLVLEVDIHTTVTSVGTVSLANGKLPTAATGWTNPTNVLTDNNVGATTITVDAILRATAFAFAATAPTGIAVEIKLRSTINPGSGYFPTAVVGLMKDGTNVAGSTKLCTAPSYLGYMTLTLGGPGDLWGTTWSAGEISASTFGVRIMNHATLVNTGFDVDYIRVYVYTATTGTIPIGKNFDFISVAIGGGQTVQYASHGEPPTAATGEVFEGQVVLNDLANPSNVRYSLPDQPDYYPKPYYIKVGNTKSKGFVTAIRLVGDILVVGLRNQIWRINKLPRAEDAYFDRDRIKEPIAQDHGIVGLAACANFATPGQPEQLAYVAHNGIHVTNGFQTSTLTEDLAWEDMVNVSKLDRSFLVNVPRLYAMLFFYVPADDTTSTYPTRYLALHYHPSHIKETGKLVVTGPVLVGATSGCLGEINRVPITLTGATDGRVYVEDRGYVNAQTARNMTADFDLVTRDIYPAAVGYEATVERVWHRHYKADSPPVLVTLTPWVKQTGADYYSPAAGQEWTTKQRDTAHGAQLTGNVSNLANAGALERTDQHFICESFAMRLQASDTNNRLGISGLFYEAQGHGLTP